MPLEIRELLIKTSINEGTQAQTASPPSANGGIVSDQESIITACVEQVLAILKEKAER